MRPEAMKSRQMFFYFGVLPALFLQFMGALAYFLVLKNNPLAPAAYAVTKLMILVWPALWLGYSRFAFKDKFPKKQPSVSLIWALATGVAISALILWVYFEFTDYFDQFSPLVLGKIQQFGLWNHYFWFALFLSIAHSLLEEYYWRWFVFRGLLIRFRWPVAALIGSLAFAAHHYVVLIQFFPSLITFLFGTAVGIGGFVWCGLYFKTGRLWVAWLSHALIDGAIMLAGYWMAF